jgi:hypothetical protein
MPFKNSDRKREYNKIRSTRVRARVKAKTLEQQTMSKEFSRTLKQILLFIGVSYTARGIESTADIPAEEIDEIHKSLISALTREQQAFMEENASEISAELGVLFRFNHF